jgi:hypothetical protein
MRICFSFPATAMQTFRKSHAETDDHNAYAMSGSAIAGKSCPPTGRGFFHLYREIFRTETFAQAEQRCSMSMMTP